MSLIVDDEFNVCWHNNLRRRACLRCRGNRMIGVFDVNDDGDTARIGQSDRGGGHDQSKDVKVRRGLHGVVVAVDDDDDDETQSIKLNGVG